MGAFFIYILKSAVCLVLFYLFFKLLLSRETFHRFNRVALLGVLLFSLLIPCIEMTTRHQVEVQQAVLSIEQLLMKAEMENTTPVEIEAGEWQLAPAPVFLSWIQIALLIYLAGIVVLVCRNVYSLLCLLRLICSGKREKLESGITLVVLCVACVAAILTGWWLTKGTPLHAVRQSRRLVDTIGWAVILPQMLAMLGGVFVVANTGESVQKVVSLFVNPDSRFMLVVIYCVGMALFTMIMGNAFAAFPVLSAGIALPFLINVHHGNPAPLLAIGMYAGYCGTLMTPMAANFNIVPAALLELKDKYQVIKIQIPTALTLLVVNVFLMYFLVFR